MNYKIYNENCLTQLDQMQENCIDSIVTDPPYELNFMGKGWDNAGVSFNKETWQKCLRVLKPGGYLLAFGGSRTFHRIAVAIEDAGFEIRDTIMWLYGSGFPKSMALDKAIEGKMTIGSANPKDFSKLNGEQVIRGNWGIAKLQKEQGYRNKDYDTQAESTTYLGKLEPTTELAKKYKGWGTALKPSFEPIIVARKPFKGSLVDNVIEYGVGGINIDECRVEFSANEPDNRVGKQDIQKGASKNPFATGISDYDNTTYKANGRFPANTILTYDETDFDEVCGGFPYTKSGNLKTGHKRGNGRNDFETFGGGTIKKNYGGDSGSASRYFYCAKASKKDRDEGLDTLRKNIHPTVKPTELMQYLVRLVTPNGGTVLDPFMGSGSTGKAVAYENQERNKDYKFIGIELDEEYFNIAKKRLEEYQESLF